MALTTEQQTRFDQLVAAGAPQELAMHSVSLIPAPTSAPISSSITGEMLQSAPTLNFQTPQPKSPFPVADIPIPELTATQPEKEATDLSKRIQEMNERLLGQSEFRTEQEQVVGVEGLRKTTLDLTNQLKALQAEAAATQISPEFEQRNVLQPFAEGERGRKLRDVGVRALIVGANLQAAQGNLASALDQVDRAVAQRFDPIKEEIAVKMANLDLILQSPEFSRADKERAEKQKQAQESRKREIELQEREQDTIWKTAIEAASRGADAITLRKIQNAGSAAEAAQLAAPFLAKKEELKTQVIEVGGRKLLIDTQIGKTIRDLGVAEAPGVPGAPATPEIERTLSGQYGDIIKSAANLVGAERGKTSRASIADAISKEDWGSAYAQIANNVEESLTGEVKSRFAAARVDYNVMLGLKQSIEDYAAGGGDMGLLVGKEEDIRRKLGIDSGKASELAVQLWREFQTYRVNMTGAAFSEAESRDYASVNPTLGKSLNLNLSVINGALNQIENRVTATVNTKVPNAKKIYEEVLQTSIDGLSEDEAYEEYLKLIK